MLKYFILIIVLFVSCTKSDDLVINSVVVRTMDAEVIKEYTKAKSFKPFYHFYSQRRFSREKETNFQYIVDVSWTRGTEKGSNRWLYDPRGYYKVLSQTITPMFQLNDNAARDIGRRIKRP